jgi:F0F1-type ATP synthase membrane subunit c/vacuolar-type H+-ATPase subunit K
MSDAKRNTCKASGGGGLAVGIGIGVALGVALDNFGAGIAIGIAIGVALGADQRRRKSSGNHRDDESPSEGPPAH